MNLFYLDQSPQLIAQMHCDQHLPKMLLEAAQILCTAARRHGAWTPYAATHEQHPVCCWAGDSLKNWQFVWDVMMALEEERKFRRLTDYKPHACIVTLEKYREPMEEAVESGCGPSRIEFTPPALAMPIQYKVMPEDPVHCYRLYYRHEKAKVSAELASWFLRQKPTWWNKYGIIEKPKAPKGGDTFTDVEED